MLIRVDINATREINFKITSKTDHQERCSCQREALSNAVDVIVLSLDLLIEAFQILPLE